MDTVILIGEIILIISYAIGVLIVIKKQRTEIGTLKTQVDAQSGILTSMKKFVDIFDPDKVAGYVKIIEEKARLEKETAMKNIEEQIKAKADKSIALLSREYGEATLALIKLTYSFGTYPFFEKVIQEMKFTIVKTTITESIEKRKEELKAQGLDMGIWSRFAAQDTYLKSLAEKKENQTTSQKK